MKRFSCFCVVFLGLIVLASMHAPLLMAQPQCVTTAVGMHRLHKCDLPFPIYYRPGGAPDECTAADIQAAIAIWNAASPDYELLYYAGTTNENNTICDGSPSNPCAYVDGINQLVWRSVGQGGSTCICNPTGTHDFEIDVRIDNTVSVCGDPDPDAFSAFTTILHELGHVLGLDHGDGDAMVSTLAPGERELVLRATVMQGTTSTQTPCFVITGTHAVLQQDAAGTGITGLDRSAKADTEIIASDNS